MLVTPVPHEPLMDTPRPLTLWTLCGHVDLLWTCSSCESDLGRPWVPCGSPIDACEPLVLEGTLHGHRMGYGFDAGVEIRAAKGRGGSCSVTLITVQCLSPHEAVD